MSHVKSGVKWKHCIVIPVDCGGCYHFNWDKTAMIRIIMRPVSGVRPSGDCENVKIPVPHYSKLILSHARHITFHEHRVDKV